MSARSVTARLAPCVVARSRRLCRRCSAVFAGGAEEGSGFRAAGKFPAIWSAAGAAGASDTGSAPSPWRLWSRLGLRGRSCVSCWESPGLTRSCTLQVGRRGLPGASPWCACSSGSGGGNCASSAPGPAGNGPPSKPSPPARPQGISFSVAGLPAAIPTPPLELCAAWWRGCPESGWRMPARRKIGYRAPFSRIIPFAGNADWTGQQFA